MQHSPQKLEGSIRSAIEDKAFQALSEEVALKKSWKRISKENGGENS